MTVEADVCGGERRISPNQVRGGGRVHVDSAAVWEPIPDDGLARFPRGVGG